ncbi:MAG: restriction endonuclease subunit S [Candidatus Saccharibacteria bacterium]|nr:restriction endonuclease subunit S [Candidatus Saccharibacteria bacterium]
MNTKLLRQKILDLAIRGKLTEQKKSDGTTKDLLAQIQDERRETKDERDAGKKDSSNVILERTSNVIASEAKQSKKSKPTEPKTIIPLNKDEAPFEIPENWEWVRLGDVCEKITDGTHHSPINTETGDFMYVTAKNIKDEGVATEGITYVSAEVHEEIYARCAPEKGDVLLIKDGATTGVVTVNNIEEPFSLLSSVALLKPGKFFESWFLAFVIRSSLFNTMIRSQMKGVGITRVTLSQINSFELPLPPLAEQKRIVEAIESAFAEITAIENNQELLKKHIKQGRQKILDLAIRGRLTQQLKTDGTTKDLLAQISKQWLVSSKQESQKENAFSNVIASATSTSSRTPIRDPFAASKNSDDVIASTAKQSKKKTFAPKEIIPLDKSEAPFEIPENWEWVRLGDVAYIASGSTPSKDCFVDEGVPYLKMYNLRNQQIDFDYKPQFVKREIHEGKLARSRTKPYDVIMNIVGPPLGKIALIPESLPECNFNQAAVLIRAHYETRLMNQYIRFYLMQMGEINSINTKGTAGQENLSLSQTQNMRLPLPPLAEQQRIVAAIESAFTEFDAMEKGIL